MHKNIPIVVGIIALFLGLAIQPSVAVQPETEIDIEQKDYLFQTIIDIANNPEVQELLEQYKYDLFKIDIDRNVYRKIFFRNPRLLFDTVFTKPSISVEYLNKCYNIGVDISKIIGEDKVFDIMESNKVADSQLFNKISNIIENDEMLNNKIETLEFFDYPILCIISILAALPFFIFFWSLGVIFQSICEIFYALLPFYILGYIFGNLCSASLVISLGFVFFAAVMCGEFSDPPDKSASINKTI